MEADKGQYRNIYKIRKYIFKSEKVFLKSEKIFEIVIFLEIIVEEFIKSEKLLEILIKLLDPQILFWKIPNKFANPRIVDKSRKI